MKLVVDEHRQVVLDTLSNQRFFRLVWTNAASLTDARSE
jgi:hypothetical protein